MDKKDKKVMVFGSGFIGTRLAVELGYELIGKDLLDPSNFSVLKKFIDSENPDVIVNAVAKIGDPNSDWCESNKGTTLESNFLVPANFARICDEKGIKLVHLSSGCIYKGDNNGEGFRETDIPNNYGNSFHLDTKILAEEFILKYDPLILRLKMPIDSTPHKRNLITKLLKYDKVIDEQNSMILVSDLIRVTGELINKGATGIYNVFNPGTISAAEIMGAYQEEIDPNHIFEVIPLDKLNTKTRRANSYMNTNKLKAEGIELPEIHNAVRRCLREYKNHQ